MERHLNHPRPVALSSAALEVLAVVAYRGPIARSGIEHIRGSASDSAIATEHATLLERGLIAHNPHHLYVTTRISRVRRDHRSARAQGFELRFLKATLDSVAHDRAHPPNDGA